MQRCDTVKSYEALTLPNPNPKTWYGCYTFMCTVHYGFLLSAALQCTPISEPAVFHNDVHHGKDAPSQLSLPNDTLQRKDALHRSFAHLNDNRVAPLHTTASTNHSVP